MDDTRRMSLRSPVRRMSMASRVSMAPNGGQNTSTSLRMSMAGSMQRRCGLKLLVIIYRKTSIPDPAGFNGQRNLDKENLGSNIKHIIEFLSFHNYNQEVSASTLRQLKDSDFESINGTSPFVVDSFSVHGCSQSVGNGFLRSQASIATHGDFYAHYGICLGNAGYYAGCVPNRVCTCS